MELTGGCKRCEKEKVDVEKPKVRQVDTILSKYNDVMSRKYGKMVKSSELTQ